MRISALIFFAAIILCSCGLRDHTGDGTLVFDSRPVQTQTLLVTSELTGYPGEQLLHLNLDIKNLTQEKIEIREVAIQSYDGLKSFPERMEDKRMLITGEHDTTMIFSFNPVNDKSLFQATGLSGLIDSAYHVSVLYSVEGKEGVRMVNLTSRMPQEIFLAYRNQHDTPVEIYHFNTTTDFDEAQRQFLLTNVTSETPPFVHITQQEVAVSGLNFRMKCFHRNDSVHAELFVVNHSDMTIRIDTSKLKLILDGSAISATELSIKKVTGSKAEEHILRKGDRTVITMRTYAVDHPERLWFSTGDSFFLANGKPLFKDDVELVRSSEGLK